MSSLEILVIGSTILEFNPLLQTFKSYRARKTDEISLGAFIAIGLVGVLWLSYGVSIHNLPLIVGNTIKLFSAVSVIIVVLAYRKRRLQTKA